MAEAFLQGLLLVFQWPAIGYLMLGIFIGIWLGAVPGLGGVIGLVLLLPFTYGMESVSALALLLGMFAVTSTSDTIASVMLGVPGTAASQATILDGYPLAKQGQGGRAFGAAFTVSAFGGVFGAIILAISLPLVLPIILSFGSPELFMLGVLGLTMVSALAGGSMVKGLTLACLGILLSTVGYIGSSAISRFSFGTDYLIDGLPLLPIILGLFGLPEIMELAVRNKSISAIPKEQSQGGGLLDGIRDAVTHRWLAVRSALIGTYIGMLPGIGASIVDWVAYGHAVQGAKDKTRFGHGDIRGVIAPEAANNATRAGALIPTVAFGIPGSLPTAILMSALIIQGLTPGPQMLTTELHVTFSMVWTIVIANIVAAGILMLWSKQVAKVAFVPGHLLVPGVVLFIFMGAWQGGATIGDWIACLVMGVIGFALKRGGWPRPPLVLAVVLGAVMEAKYSLSMRTHEGFEWLYTRPVTLALLALVLLSIVLSLRSFWRKKTEASDQGHEASAGEGLESNPVLSLPLSLLIGAAFGWAVYESSFWPMSLKQFPLAAAIPGLCLIAIVIAMDIQGIRREAKVAGTFRHVWRGTASRTDLPKVGVFFFYISSLLVTACIIGQKLALPIFIFVYLRRWGGYSWRLSAGYALISWAFLIVFYDRVMGLFWYPAWLHSWLPDMLPSWFPVWIAL